MTSWATPSATLNWFGDTVSQWSSTEPVVATPARKSVIFDFDGTIADSFNLCLEVGNRLTEEYGIAPVTPEKLERWRHMTSKQILSELDLPILQLPRMLRRFKAALREEVVNFPFILGMRETILELWDQDYVIGVVTSNSAETVRAFLNHQGIGHLFEFVESCPYYLGKQHTLRRLSQRHHLDRAQMIYVGDETRDIDAAKKLQIHSVAVTWGFNSPAALRDRQPDYLINHPRELIAIAAALKSAP
jgi:phosphoglycolate phosphatase